MIRVEFDLFAGFVLVALSEQKTAGGPPPTEFRIFPFSEKIETTKGTFKFSPADCDVLLAERALHKARVQIDYDHLAIKAEKPGDGKAAGWCDLEKRIDGLYAVNVKWTPTAFKMLEDGEYASISPFFGATKKDRRIVVLMNVAITNLPATLESEQLVAASHLFLETEPLTQHKDGHTMAHKLGGYLAAKLKKDGMSLKALSEKSGLSEDRLRALHDGADPTPEETKQVGKGFGLKGDEVDEQLSAFDNAGPEDDDTDDEEEDKKKVAAARRLIERIEAKGGRKPARKTEGKSEAELVLIELTQTTDANEQAEILRGYASMAKEFVPLKKQFDANQKTMAEQRRQQLIEKGKAEGKLTPGYIRFWATRSIEDFEEFLKTAPTLSIQNLSLREGDPGAAAAILTHEEIEVCHLSHSSVDEMAKFVQNERAGTNEQLVLASYYAQPKA